MHRTGRFEDAERALRETLSIYRKALADSHPRTAEALTALGELLIDRGRPEEAETLLREALAIRQAKLVAGDRRIAETRQALGLAVAARGRREEAERLLLESHREFENNQWAARQLSESRRRLARFYTAWGKEREARKYRGNGSR